MQATRKYGCVAFSVRSDEALTCASLATLEATPLSRFVASDLRSDDGRFVFDPSPSLSERLRQVCALVSTQPLGLGKTFVFLWLNFVS